MGLFGGSSSATSSNSNDFTLNSNDSRYIEGGSTIGGNVSIGAGKNLENVQVTTTDFGAVEGALSLGESVVERLSDFGNNVLQRQSVSQDSNLSAIKDFAANVASSGQDRISKSFQNVALVALAIGGLGLVMGVFRK